ncbi:MAG TPA: hypothetical protein ENK18_10670, partial [Deltaproteobacteria bacterium]|nr:hypothetical protein [Deltaproteobacteria bacterium]
MSIRSRGFFMVSFRILFGRNSILTSIHLHMATENESDQDRHHQARTLAVALHACGAPTHLLEERLDAFLAQLGVEGTVVATPTALWLQLGPRSTVVRTRPAELDLGRLADLQRWLDADPSSRPPLERILIRRGSWSPSAQHLAFIAGSSCSGALLGQGWIDVVAAAVAGAAVRAGLSALQGSPWAPLQGIGAGAIAGLVGSASAPLGAVPSAVALAGIIALVPGLGLTLAVTELCAGMWTAGTTRLVAAALVSAQLATGLTLGATLLPAPAPALACGPLPPGLEPALVLAIAPASFAILLGVRPRDLPPAVVVSAVGYLVASSVGAGAGAAGAAGLVGLASAVLAHTRGGSSLASMVPGVLLLVPGSVGVRSVDLALRHDTLGAMGLAADALGIAGALALGLASAQALWLRHTAQLERGRARPGPRAAAQPHPRAPGPGAVSAHAPRAGCARAGTAPPTATPPASPVWRLRSGRHSPGPGPTPRPGARAPRRRCRAET